jgi:hypothetical protein
MPQNLKGVVGKKVKEMLHYNIISSSNGLLSSPIVLVKKKNVQFRFCVDYRELNAVTTKDCYPLARIAETLDSLAGKNYFSTLNLASGYWQLEVDQKDRPKTAFTTGQGLFEFSVMPFGLTNAPSTFQRLMETVLAGLTWNHCLYIWMILSCIPPHSIST